MRRLLTAAATASLLLAQAPVLAEGKADDLGVMAVKLRAESEQLAALWVKQIQAVIDIANTDAEASTSANTNTYQKCHRMRPEAEARMDHSDSE